MSLQQCALKAVRSKKILLLLLWLGIITGVIIVWRQSQIPFADIPHILEAWLREFGMLKAALLYIIIYTFRVFLFFPATFLSIIAGTLFGPWWGTLYLIIGSNFSANFAFVLARYFGRNFVQCSKGRWVQRFDQKLSENGIITILTMRLLFLPFDVVSFGCGMTKMRQKEFAIGSFVGTLPGSLVFVLLGGAASAQAAGTFEILGRDIPQRTALLLLSVLFFVGGLIVARFLRKKSTIASAITCKTIS